MDYDFEESVGYWVTLASLAIRRALNEKLTPHGITCRQSQVLGWLVLEGELSQVELACRMDIEAPTIKGLIDRMEAAGWVKRSVCPTDRRKRMIRPTEEAEPIWSTIASCAREVRRESTNGLQENEVAELRRLLRIVHENLSRNKVSAGE